MKSARKTMVAAAIAMAVAGCHRDQPAETGGKSADVRQRLLDLAFAAVEKMPVDPHLKNKARAQYAVVGCALDIDQPLWAEGYAQRTLYWEQGASYADIALYYAQHGNAAAAKGGLAQAEGWMERNESKFRTSATEQAWRVDRVRTKMAQAAMALGDQNTAQACQKNLEPEDVAEIVRHEALQSAGQDPEAALAKLNELAKSGAFADVSSAVQGLIQLYDLQYTNEPVRKAIEEKVGSFAATNTPVLFQIDMATRMGETDLAHGAAAAALAKAFEGRKLLENHPCDPRFYIPMATKLAALRCRAGEKAEGLEELAACMRLFDDRRERILDIDQAGILCSLAEACQKTGDTPTALGLYNRAIAAGQLNPNSRPRAEDLVRICCSMARNGAAPSDDVMRALEAMGNKLGNPW